MGEHPFPDITADDILRSIRRNSLRLAVKMAVCHFLMAAMTVLSAFMLIAVHRSIGEMLLWGMLALYSIFYNCIYFPEFRTHLRNYRDPASAEIFRRYGKPEKIVSILTDLENVQALSSRDIILTHSYIMARGDFLSFVPLSDVMWFSVNIQPARINCVRYVCLTAGRKGKGKRSSGIAKPVTYWMEHPLYYKAQVGHLLSLKKQKQQLIAELEAHLQKHAPHLAVNH